MSLYICNLGCGERWERFPIGAGGPSSQMQQEATKAEVCDGTGVPRVTAIQGVMRRKTRIQRGKNLRSGHYTEALGLSQSSFRWQGDIGDLCDQELL